MFAIIKTGGKQYKVSPKDIIKVEKLEGSSGDTIEFTDVLMMGEGATVNVGSPLVAKARVLGKVRDQIRDDKVLIFKKNRRHNYRRKNGHRQYLTVVEITDVLAEGEAPKKTAAAPKAKATETKEKAPSSKAKPATSTEKKAAPKDKKEAGSPEEKGAAKASPKAKKPVKA